MSVVMGTAGHIDHGKTALVRALTGMDCDRLEEEKRRGITIELGFASLALPGGRSLSIVDVPGHERFVRNMVAGAAGVDFVMLVIAADEGVMPQTREHLEICSLLGIRAGLVALTKIDAVDEDLLALAVDDVSQFLAGTFLEGAPILPVSAHTGAGMKELIGALAEIEAGLAPRRAQDLFRLPVDRIFTLHGHGTVITGTMIGGQTRIGETIRLYPGEKLSKARGLQSHGQAVELALPGRRTAINVPDLAVEDIHRGEVAGHPGALFPSTRWVLRLTCLKSSPRPLRHRGEVHFHHGAKELQARLYFPDREKLLPGESAVCEARFSEPAVAVFGDHCVARSFSPLRTVAGGVVLHPLGVNLRRRAPGFAGRLELLERLAKSLENPSPAAARAGGGQNAPAFAPDASGASGVDEERLRIALSCTEGAEHGLSFARLRVLTNIDAKNLEKQLAALSTRQEIFCFDKDQRLYVPENAVHAMGEACLAAIGDFHGKFSEKAGMPRSELLSGWGRTLPPKLAHFVMERLIKMGQAEAEGDLIRLPGHAAAFSGSQASLSEALLKAHLDAGLSPPNTNDLLAALGVDKKEAAPVFAALRASGQLVRVAEGVWYAAGHLEDTEKAVRGWFESHETIDLAGLKSITGLSRKYLVALLEYFDTRKITLRVGDTRVLRDKANTARVK